MRFLIDRCAGRLIADWLRKQGHDVVESRELGLILVIAHYWSGQLMRLESSLLLIQILANWFTSRMWPMQGLFVYPMFQAAREKKFLKIY